MVMGPAADFCNTATAPPNCECRRIHMLQHQGQGLKQEKIRVQGAFWILFLYSCLSNRRRLTGISGVRRGCKQIKRRDQVVTAGNLTYSLVRGFALHTERLGWIFAGW
ncbi:hypothetical protein V6N13_062804 [Hibiscus sabdariffa]